MASTRRRYLPRLAAPVAFLGCTGLFGSAAQLPKEEEDPKSTVKKIISVDDGQVNSKKGTNAPPGNSPDVRLDELAQAADEAHDPVLKAIFAKYVAPFDRLTERGGAISVKPIPIRKSEWPPSVEAVNVTPLDATGKPNEPRVAMVKNIRGLEHFETLVQTEAEALLKQMAEGTAVLDNIAASEKLLAAALRFHDYVRERNLRRGKGWDDIRTPLAAKLREVRLDYLRATLVANDAMRIREVRARLMDAYPKDAVVAQEVAVACVGEADRLAKSSSYADLVRAKELLDELETRFPGAGGDTAHKVRAQLRDVAKKAFIHAKEKKDAGDIQTARDELSRAAAIDPKLDGIRELQRELDNTIRSPDEFNDDQKKTGQGQSDLRREQEKEIATLKRNLEELKTDLGVLKERSGKLETAHERADNWLWSFTPNIISTIVSGIIAALVAYSVSRKSSFRNHITP